MNGNLAAQISEWHGYRDAYLALGESGNLTGPAAIRIYEQLAARKRPLSENKPMSL